MKTKRDREEACYICGHYHNFEAGEPCSICGHVLMPNEKRPAETVIPTAIIPGFLYLGSYDTASRAELLKAMAITHVLNTVPTCQALYKNTFTYHTVTSTPPVFQECFDFIDSIKSSDSKILIYCMSGTSRSPSIVIAYLMKERKWRLSESYKWVKQKRPSISINPEDTKRLIDLELQLHGSCSVPSGLAALDTTCTGGLLSGTPGNQSTAQPAAGHPSGSNAGFSFGSPSFGGMGQPQWSMSHQPGQAPFHIASASLPSSTGSLESASLPFVFGSAAPGSTEHNTEMEL